MKGFQKTLGAVLAIASYASGAAAFQDPGSRAQKVRFSASNAHTCAVLDDGSIRCWGENPFGQLGNGTTTSFERSPVRVSDLGTILSVGTGDNFSCALRSLSGTVACWGDNSNGQFGTGTTTSSSVAVTTNKISNVISLAVGSHHVCALVVGGDVSCWGSNITGQVGQPSGTSTFAPQTVALPLPAVAVAAGGLHSCAVLVDGTVRCWGFNVSGELGNGTLTQSNTPVTVSGLSKVIDVITGDAHSCAIQMGGLAFCWGRGQEGELGNFGSVNSAIPVQVALPGVVSLAAGTKNTCATTVAGALFCWGDNTSGQIGDGTTTQRLGPTQVLGVSNMVQTAIGSGHACGVDSRGVAQCWGTNTQGQLGNGTTSSTLLPSTVGGFSGSIGALRLGVGVGFNCAARGTGGVSCWGHGNSGELGDNQGLTSANPVNAGVADTVALVTGGSHSCSVNAAGAVFCWGDNSHGQMGNGDSGGIHKTPFAVGSLSTVTGLAAGSGHTCALKVDSSVVCWGANESGELGIGSTGGDSNVPVPVSGLGPGLVRAITAGSSQSCALMFDRTVRCWGSNLRGELGNGVVNSVSNVPVQVTGISAAVAVATGSNHACAVLMDGTARCWGSDIFGELGNGIITNSRPVPDVVTGITDAISVSAGSFGTCVVRAESSASCWGHNVTGQLGAVDASDHSSPTPVIRSFVTVQGIQIPQKLAFVTAIGISGGHACALLASGQPLCWGDNSLGAVGDGTFDPKPRPTIVNSFTANVDPAVTFRSNGRIADVTVLLNCPAGGQAFIQLTLDQGQVEGDGIAAEACADGMVRVALTVPAHGPHGFQAGAATAHVEATVRENGHITQDQHWTRAVTLAVAP